MALELSRVAVGMKSPRFASRGVGRAVLLALMKPSLSTTAAIEPKNGIASSIALMLPLLFFSGQVAETHPFSPQVQQGLSATASFGLLHTSAA